MYLCREALGHLHLPNPPLHGLVPLDKSWPNSSCLHRLTRWTEDMAKVMIPCWLYHAAGHPCAGALQMWCLM